MSKTFLLNPEFNHSITYNPETDALTTNLTGEQLPIERTKNKAKLLLLIYFVQRDIHRNKHPDEIVDDVSLDLRIVERIIWQFSNHHQARRTVLEYTVVGDHVDVTNGLDRTRIRDKNGGPSQAVAMTVTADIRNVLLEWVRDVLGAEGGKKAVKSTEQDGKKSVENGKKRKADGPVTRENTASEVDEIQQLPPPKTKRKRVSKPSPIVERDVLTPGSDTLPLSFSRVPATDPIRKLFSSPAPKDNLPAGPRRSPQLAMDFDVEPSASTLRLGDDLEEPEFSAMGLTTDDTDLREDIQTVMNKVALYARHIYFHARKDGGEDKVRKYSRKLNRLSKEFQGNQIKI